jgi:hypothetical protein
MSTNRVLWTARCKSGYTFNGRACARSTPRGMLLCSDCLTAEPIAAQPKIGALRALLVAVLAIWR